MDRDLLEAFGLEEDEFIAVLVALLFMIPLLWFLMRGCAPVAELTDAGIPVELDGVLESDICSIDPIVAPFGFTGGELTLTGQGRANSDVDIIVDGRTVETVRPDFNDQWSTAVNFEDAGEYVVVLSCLEEDSTRSRSEAMTLTVAGQDAIADADATAVLDEEAEDRDRVTVTPAPTAEPEQESSVSIPSVVQKAAPFLFLSQYLSETDRESGH